jgi:hypothetical protein
MLMLVLMLMLMLNRYPSQSHADAAPMVLQTQQLPPARDQLDAM